MAERANFLPLSKYHLLNEACVPVAQAFDANPMLVGSCTTTPDYRDVDVRVILADSEFDALFAGRDALWSLVCLAVSERLSAASGLPVDFQVQRMSQASADRGRRYALAMPLLYAGGPPDPDATVWDALDGPAPYDDAPAGTYVREDPDYGEVIVRPPPSADERRGTA